ncbi:D-glycero-beta-D-manno-heptose-7-phosphate kinase [soil metagenome]
MSHLLDALAKWRGFHAIVVGDFMLDEIVLGDVDRLANDAPVPVMLVRETQQRPGGSANVCLDLVALRGTVAAVGVVGDDHAAERLRALLSEAGVSAGGLSTDATRPTTVKRSLIGLAQHRHAQKMFRMDYESTAPVSGSVERTVLAAFDHALEHAQSTRSMRVVACIEDYHKGVCTPAVCAGVIERCRAAGVEVLVDPAAIADYAKYAGATALTPNRAEAEQAAAGTGREDARPARRAREHAEDYADVAEHLVSTLGLDAAVITLDKHGALLLEGKAGATSGEISGSADGDSTGPRARAVPTAARKIYDVTGAGDMVLAALAAARANGAGWLDAVRFANAAAGLEVEEVGVVPIPLERIVRDIVQREHASLGKLRTLEQLTMEIAALRQGGARDSAGPTVGEDQGPRAARRGPTVVFTNGCFDLLHIGHIKTLERAAELGDFLVVGVNDDAGVRRLKGPGRPVNDVAERAGMLAALQCVGAVIVFAEETPQKIVEAITPDVLVKGAQYDIDRIPGAAHVLQHGGRVELVEVVPGRSTTRTVEAIRAAGGA